MAREVYEYRELLLALAWRDIRVKYKQAVMGITQATNGLRPAPDRSSHRPIEPTINTGRTRPRRADA
ncbi:MAG: hypothetical protein JJU36_10360 [Phycisphaeraceae bacterium]|nr:hypothetical protein [Phycisphaeraceae bacterium]